MNRKYIIHKLLIGVALLLQSSCRNTEDVFIPIEPEVPQSIVGTPVQFAMNVAFPETTRAVETLAAGTTMTVGMTVGSGNASYVDYTYDGTSWKVTEGTEPLRWQDMNADHSFIAVSPARDMSDLTVIIPGTFTEADVTACEKLLTTTAAVTTKPTLSVGLKLSHPLVKITVLSSAATVTLKGQTLSTSIDAATGGLGSVSHSGATGTIAMYKTDQTFTAYILPRTAGEQLSYTSNGDKKFPANTAMPAGSNFSCRESLTP